MPDKIYLNHDFIATLRSYASKLESNPITDGASSQCVTVEGDSNTRGEQLWIQLHAGLINFPHLDSPEKDLALGTILDAIDGLEDVELEPGGFVSFSISSLETPVVDRLLIEVHRDYLESSDELRLSCSTI